ncbi:MAG TPA: OmpH family outer membrane protein [Brevundimonas sp.]|jgi:Skp family chaperone for outer membrane proteins|uniref:OmpH family outer membrane protein n=1 Tax=Brevundimonas sp. TaxID=1871086 RepID=UPI002CA4CACA|nr:OmpH family outer membrane protein [Brevundimonas sp.]HRH19508.1 OmpH family outer membrane protein [Brevundimonas sp.]
MKLPLLASAAAMAFAIAGTAAAQPAQPTNPGPVIPGVCTFNQGRAVAGSMVGQAVSARMQQLTDAVRAELQPEGAAIEAEVTALQQGQASLPQDQFQQRAGALQQRATAYQQLAAQREGELQYTQGLQVQRIGETMDPILVQVYQERGCGLLFDRAAMFGGNPAMDITDRVVELMNQQLQTLSFDRSPLPQQ